MNHKRPIVHNTSPLSKAPISTRRVLLALLSGLMLTAAFPPAKFEWIAWFALVPLLGSLKNQSPSQAFKLGFYAGLAHYLTLIYWIVVVLGHYGNLNFVASLGTFLLLCLYLALYPALFTTLCTWLKGSRSVLIFIPAFWVSLEYLRAHLLTGFPWCLLGHTQYTHLNIIQIADLSGVYGLSFVIVLVNGFIYRLISKDYGKAGGSLKWDVLLVVIVIAGTLGYGHYCLLKEQTNNRSRRYLRTAIIQGNIDQSIKWDPAYQTETMKTYQGLTRSTYDFRPGLIVWPETSLPFFFQNNREFSPGMFSLAEESGESLLFGSPAYKRTDGITRYYNRAYLISPETQTVQYYDKVHLVPFGEYVPLKKFLFFVSRLVPAAGDFQSGNKVMPLSQGDLSAGVLICFEAIFPEPARTHVREGANILVNLTNDAWFGMTSAPYQHLSMAVFRAVENRTPMVRAANTGFSAFIGRQGNILEQGTLFNKEVIKASVDISRSPSTFYTCFGDLFALFVIFVSIIRIIVYLWKTHKGH
ncbi:MAG: apolipoprotein N-acyltransferase [Thermodesulfobacteriota bacterium]|nr:apolipoprotein N-acyltransferase [Thermodesulfobacteriota bacterium]